YASDSNDLIAGFVDNNGRRDAYLYDRVTGQNTLLSHDANSNSSGANNWTSVPSISADGRFVCFASAGSNLISGFVGFRDGASKNDLYIYDRGLGSLKLVTANKDNPNGGGSDTSYFQTVSADGSVISYLTRADNLVAGDFNAATHDVAPDYQFYDAVVYV